MRLLGRTEITTTEKPDGLQFVVSREHGWLDSLVPLGLLAVLVIGAWVLHHYIFAILAVLLSAFGWAKYLSDPTTRLSVSLVELIARGNLASTFDNEIRISTHEIKSLLFSTGGEGDRTGLYVHHGWTQICLIPNIDRKQTEDIITAIRRRFPDMELGDREPASLFFSGDGGITKLGLSSGNTGKDSAPEYPE